MARADVLVLCYHAVSPTWPAETSVTPGRLQEQLESLLDAGYEGATLTDALTVPSAGRTVAVTFDDAHRSVHRAALPIMERLNIPGTIFVPTDFPDSGRPMGWPGYTEWMGTEHEQELDCLSWTELGDLQDVGWEIGSHTCSHPRLPGLDDETLARELRESRLVCEEHFGSSCSTLAYPYGDHDTRVVRATREAGYAFAVTVPTRTASALPLQWPRVAAYHSDTAARLRLRVWRRGHPAVDTAARVAAETLRPDRSQATSSSA